MILFRQGSLYKTTLVLADFLTVTHAELTTTINRLWLEQRSAVIRGFGL